MITKIHGVLVSLADAAAILSANAFEYEVLIPDFVRRRLQSKVGEHISLHTIHYLDGNPAQGRVTPRLVGFLSPVEREFFEMFCSVDGVGAKKALRAMVRPVREVAVLIADQDDKGLSALPGIGPAMAERIIAKLRRKMSKFALIAARDEGETSEVHADVVDETFRVLLALGHSEAEARRLLDTALSARRQYKDVDALLQAIFQQSHGER